MDDFKAQVAQGKILVGVGAGTGITAKCSEKADVDMLIIYNSGRFRMAGRGSLSGLYPMVMQMRSFRRWDRKYYRL